MDIRNFIKIGRGLYEAGTPLEIVGAPGMGKSSAVREIAAQLSENGEPFGLVTHFLATMEPVDVRGFIFPYKEGGDPVARFTRPTVFPTRSTVEVFVNGELATGEVDIPKRGIVFLDEFGQSSEDMQKVAAPFILEKRLGEHHLPDGWVVWAAGNRAKDRSGVGKRLAHMQNRICTLPVHMTFATWEPWANKSGVHPLVITFAKKYPSKVFIDEVPKEHGVPYCTARSLTMLDTTLRALRTPDMPAHVMPSGPEITEIVEGWIGTSTAVDFMTHLRLSDDLPDLSEVERSPNKAKLPQKADGQFVMAGMLSHHTTKKNAKAFIAYMERMSVDVQVLYVRSVMAREPRTLMVPEFSSWIAKNQELLAAANSA